MALIKCPECGKEISDKSVACIHCGFPLQQQTLKKVVVPSFTELGTKVATASRIISNLKNIQMYEATELLRNGKVVVQDALTDEQANKIADMFTQHDICVEILNTDSTIENVDAQSNTFKICCPECGSTEYHAGARGYSILTGFIGSGKVVMTCLRCGHRWKPNK